MKEILKVEFQLLFDEQLNEIQYSCYAGSAFMNFKFGIDGMTNSLYAFIPASQVAEGNSELLSLNLGINPITKYFFSTDSQTSIESIDIDSSLCITYSGFEDGTIKRFSTYKCSFDEVMNSEDHPKIEPADDNMIYDIVLAKNRTFIAASFPDQGIILKIGNGWKYYKTIKTDYKDICPIAISPDSKKVAINKKKEISIYNIE